MVREVCCQGIRCLSRNLAFLSYVMNATLSIHMWQLQKHSIYSYFFFISTRYTDRVAAQTTELLIKNQQDTENDIFWKVSSQILWKSMKIFSFGRLHVIPLFLGNVCIQFGLHASAGFQFQTNLVQSSSTLAAIWKVF